MPPEIVLRPKWYQLWTHYARYEAPDGTVLADVSQYNGAWYLRIDDVAMGTCPQAQPLMIHAAELIARAAAEAAAAPGLALQSNDSQ